MGNSIIMQACREGAAREGGKPCLPAQPFPTPTAAATLDRRQQAPPGRGITDHCGDACAGGPQLQGANWPLLVFSVIALLGVALFLLYLWTRTRNNRTRDPVSAAGRRSAPSGAAGYFQPYDALVQGLIGTYDLTDSQVVRAHVEKSLRGAGITAVVPAPGDPFDASLHNGVAGARSPEPGQVFHIARVLRPGWRSSEGVLRPPDVEVFGER